MLTMRRTNLKEMTSDLHRFSTNENSRSLALRILNVSLDLRYRSSMNQRTMSDPLADSFAYFERSNSDC